MDFVALDGDRLAEERQRHLGARPLLGAFDRRLEELCACSGRSTPARHCELGGGFC